MAWTGFNQIQPGEVLDQKYRIEALVAKGGMGAVYLATHLFLQKQVAIKTLHAEQVLFPVAIRRLQREAVAASRIKHDNICEFTDVGMAEDGTPYLVMEYLKGQCLQQRIAAGPLSIPEVLRISDEILSAVGAAHRQGVIHRDLKPSNVFLQERSEGERVKVLDFGIASILDGSERADPKLTVTGMLIGTPAYMSPQQACGQGQVGPEADVYSVGVILYEMLAGKPAFGASDPTVVIANVIMGEFPPLRQHRPDVPPALEEIIHRAMSTLPEVRPTVSELEEALDPTRTVPTKRLSVVPVARARPRAALLGVAMAMLVFFAFLWVFSLGDDHQDSPAKPVESPKAPVATAKAPVTTPIAPTTEVPAESSPSTTTALGKTPPIPLADEESVPSPAPAPKTTRKVRKPHRKADSGTAETKRQSEDPFLLKRSPYKSR